MTDARPVPEPITGGDVVSGPRPAPELLVSGEVTRRAPQSPAQLFWRQFRRSQLAVGGATLLAIFYLLSMFAPFVAPSTEGAMDRGRFFHPPQPLHWIDAGGKFH